MTTSEGRWFVVVVDLVESRGEAVCADCDDFVECVSDAMQPTEVHGPFGSRVAAEAYGSTHYGPEGFAALEAVHAD